MSSRFLSTFCGGVFEFLELMGWLRRDKLGKKKLWCILTLGKAGGNPTW